MKLLSRANTSLVLSLLLSSSLMGCIGIQKSLAPDAALPDSTQLKNNAESLLGFTVVLEVKTLGKAAPRLEMDLVETSTGKRTRLIHSLDTQTDAPQAVTFSLKHGAYAVTGSAVRLGERNVAGLNYRAEELPLDLPTKIGKFEIKPGEFLHASILAICYKEEVRNGKLHLTSFCHDTSQQQPKASIWTASFLKIPAESRFFLQATGKEGTQKLPFSTGSAENVAK